MEIQSVPSGATFTTNTGHRGTTPATVTVPDDVVLQIQYAKEGYLPANISLPPRMSGWFLGNLILGGIIGIIIDLASGNWRVHDGEVSITLIPVQG